MGTNGSRASILILALLSGVLLWLIACSPATSLKLSNLNLTARQFTGPSNMTEAMAAVTGTAQNAGNAAIKNCVITVTFFDENKNTIGSANTTREAMQPGETWNFTAQLTGSDAWKARTYQINAANQ